MPKQQSKSRQRSRTVHVHHRPREIHHHHTITHTVVNGRLAQSDFQYLAHDQYGSTTLPLSSQVRYIQPLQVQSRQPQPSQLHAQAFFHQPQYFPTAVIVPPPQGEYIQNQPQIPSLDGTTGFPTEFVRQEELTNHCANCGSRVNVPICHAYPRGYHQRDGETVIPAPESYRDYRRFGPCG